MQDQNVDTLQQIINKRAEKRLLGDILKLSEVVRNNRLLNHSDSTIPSVMITKDSLTKPRLMLTDDDKKQSVRGYAEGELESKSIASLLWASKSDYSGDIHISGKYAARLFEHWLPTYIKEETEALMAKIDQLKEDVDYLFDNKQDI